MVLTPSTMLPLGTPAPAFDLPDVVTGKRITLASFAERKALLVMFICRHCPYVQHVQEELARFGKDYEGKGLGILAVSSNDVTTHPEDAPDKLAAMARRLGFGFPFCYDESQAAAQAYRAACTPDFFVFDGAKRLVYRGQLDDSRPGNGKPVTGKDLRAATDAALAGRPVPAPQKASIGCNIKWRAGNEPAYFAASGSGQ